MRRILTRLNKIFRGHKTLGNEPTQIIRTWAQLYGRDRNGKRTGHLGGIKSRESVLKIASVRKCKICLK